jgi:hypothetical protein
MGFLLHYQKAYHSFAFINKKRRRRKKMNYLKKVISIAGRIFYVDATDESCKKLGFRSGDRIILPLLHVEIKGTIVGVAPATEKINPQPLVLWFTLDGEDGRVCYSYPSIIKPSME